MLVLVLVLIGVVQVQVWVKVAKYPINEQTHSKIVIFLHLLGLLERVLE